MSRILKRALKIAIFPASLIVAGKFVAVFTVIAVKQLEFTIENMTDGFFSIQIFLEDDPSALMVNSYSNLTLLLLIAIPTYYMLTKKILLNNVEGNPRTIVKLTKLNMLKWITKDSTAILSITIWTIYLWIVAGICISSTLQYETYSWIAVCAGITALISSWGLIKTYEKETDKIYPKDNEGYI